MPNLQRNLAVILVLGQCYSRMGNLNSDLMHDWVIPGNSKPSGWPPDVALQTAIRRASWMILLTAVNRMSPNTPPPRKRTHLLPPARKKMSPGTAEALKCRKRVGPVSEAALLPPNREEFLVLLLDLSKSTCLCRGGNDSEAG